MYFVASQNNWCYTRARYGQIVPVTDSGIPEIDLLPFADGKMFSEIR